MTQWIFALQGAPAGQPSGGGVTPSFYIMLGLVFAVFYFLMIAPQRKQRKKMQEMLDSLKNGDKIVTSGGIYGTIVRANQGEEAVRVRVAPTVEIEVARSAISGLQAEPVKGS